MNDRRLSYVGAPVDESDKSFILETADGRFAVGYTGLAVAGRFRTHEWLLETLVDTADKSGYLVHRMLEQLRLMADQTFGDAGPLKGFPRSARRLSVMTTGYLHRYEPPLIGNSILTNFQDFESGADHAESWPEPKASYWTEKRPWPEPVPTLVQRVGGWSAMTKGDEVALCELLRQQKPVTAIVGKAVELVREMSDRPQAQGTIGKQLMSLVISPDLSQDPAGQYH